MNRLKIPRRVFGSRVLDFSLGFFGFGLAAASAYLPYHVYTKPDQFGPPEMALTRLDAVEGETVATVEQPLFDNPAIDPIVTGTVPQAADGPSKALRQIPANPPPDPIVLPGEENETGHADYDLIFASRGRALIRYGDEILAVATGSRLPDGSRVRTITRQQGRWQLETSKDQLLVMR